MKNFFQLQKMFTLAILAGLMVSCSTDQDEMMATEETISANATIESSALIGTWDIVSMNSDVAVDLNFDGTSSKDVLEETHCFDPMFFTFGGNGDITTGQAKLDFGANDDEFECGYGEYSAEYEIVNDNELVVTFTVKGTVITQTKTIKITTVGEDEFLHVYLTDAEAAEYVTDPGTTVASEVGEIETIYKKQK